MRRFIPVCGPIVFAVLAHSATALAVDCFVDGVGGSDTNNGLSETAAWKSPSKIGATCTVVKFKRGSVFDIAAGSSNYAVNLMTLRNIKTLTNYGDANQPLPKFIKPHVPSSGGVLASYGGGVTIDGLYLSGSRSDANMSNLADGICVMLGPNTTITNCEITLCDIGMMTTGENVTVKNNYVHDLSISVDAAPGVDPNAVGGAEGIFVNSSHVEVAYNRFVNCSTAAQWVSNTNGGGVRCDGGATEVSVPNGTNGAAGEVTDVKIHHNFSYNSCGFFEVASMFQSGATYVKGKFTNSVFHDNVMVDSGWISLLQINNTKLTNVRWENNTIIHHDRGTTTDASGNTINLNDFGSSAIQAIPFNGTSSGVTGGGEISQGDIYWTNNLWYFDPKVKPYNPLDATHASTDEFLKNIVVAGDALVSADPGFKDITSTTDPTAYDLVKGSTVIDKGVTNANVSTDITMDFSNRPRPVGAALDLGAFEYPGDNAGGASGTGGSSATATGGVSATGGRSSSGGTAAKATGGAPTATGGAIALGTGGDNVTGGASSTGGSVQNSAGGANPATGGSSTSILGGAATTTPTTSDGAATDVGACSCKVAGNSTRSSPVRWVGLVTAVLGIVRLRRRHSQPALPRRTKPIDCTA